MTFKQLKFGAAVMCVVAMTIVAADAAHAATIQGGDVIKLDFSTVGDGDGGSVADWNQVSTGLNTGGIAAGSVIRDGDAAVITGVSIGFTNLVTANFNNDGNAAGWAGTAGDPYYILAADDIYFHGNNGNQFEVTFGGLDPEIKYNVRIYALTSGNPTSFEQFIVTDGAGFQIVTPTRGDRWSAATLEASDMVFSDLTVNGSNSIVIKVQQESSQFYTINAIVLEAVPTVPEPSSLLLAAVGLVGLALRRRRRNRG